MTRHPWSAVTSLTSDTSIRGPRLAWRGEGKTEMKLIRTARLVGVAAAVWAFAITDVNAQAKPTCKWHGLEFSQGALFCAHAGTAITCSADGTWQQIPAQTQCLLGTSQTTSPTILVSPPRLPAQ